MDFALVHALIASPGEATTRSLYKDRHAGLFWVDWREADDYIVKLAADAMGRKDLSAQWQEDGLRIMFEGRTTPVPLEQKPGEQDITLAALNRALHPGFELRWVRASEGGDTLAFQILPAKGWQALEAHYGEAVAQAFARLDPSRPLFDAGSDSQPSLQATREAVAASMGVPLQAPFLASVRYSLLPAQAVQPPRNGAGIVTEPLAGELYVAFECVDAGAVRLVTQAELRAAGIDHAALHERARANCTPIWEQLRDSGTGQLSRLHAAGNPFVASVALHAGLWNSLAADGFQMRVAFPRRDLVLMADGRDAVAVSVLVAMVEAFDPADPETLSRRIHAWQGEGWAVHEPAPHERAFVSSPRWQAAERGDLRAQFEIAMFFQTATHYAEAVRRYQRIAEQVKARPVDSRDMFENGSAALCNLADKYEHGLGVAQDLKLARQHYMRSAAMGNAVAQYSIGMLYAAGRGVPVDPPLAVTWLQQSAQQGYQPAQQVLMEIEQMRRGNAKVPRDAPV